MKSATTTHLINIFVFSKSKPSLVQVYYFPLFGLDPASWKREIGHWIRDSVCEGETPTFLLEYFPTFDTERITPSSASCFPFVFPLAVHHRFRFDTGFMRMCVCIMRICVCVCRVRIAEGRMDMYAE